MFALVEKLLISRSPASAPVIFICAAHQFAAECHIRLIRKAVKQVLSTTSLERDKDKKALKSLQAVAERIEAMGKTFKVKKHDGHLAASNWNDDHFAVTHNESQEFANPTPMKV
jgi:hypothetical protein